MGIIFSGGLICFDKTTINFSNTHYHLSLIIAVRTNSRKINHIFVLLY